LDTLIVPNCICQLVELNISRDASVKAFLKLSMSASL
jgi:hypothetical protein